MVHFKLVADLLHNSVMSSGQVESKGFCAALRFHLEDPLSRGWGPRTKEACVVYGMSR
jgi:hypothetical protein